MAEVELVIRIPEEVYRSIKEIPASSMFGIDCDNRIRSAILSGTPLPKGHARLIDMKNLQKFVSQYTEYDAIQLILADREDYMPTIIEADKEYGVEIITRGNCMMCGKELNEGLFFCKECEAKVEERAIETKHEDIAKAFQLGLAFGFGEKHDEMDKMIDEIKKAVTPQQILDKIRDEILEYIDDLDVAAEICDIFDKYKVKK